MSQESLVEYIPRVRNRYERMRGKGARGRVLDEFCAVSGWERKYALKVLRGKRRGGRGPGRGGAPRRYEEAVVEILTYCWRQMEQPCGKRMVGMLPLWVRHLGEVEKEVREKVLQVSAATIDRLLAGVKISAGRKKPLVPRSDVAIKALVAIRAERWNTREVGWTEVDTVAHCGGDMGGSFIWSLTSVEIYSDWAEVRAVWNRGQAATWEGLVAIEQAQPFFLRGIDSDGGGEFLNHHLYGYLKERGIHQTRARPYRKNDGRTSTARRWNSSTYYEATGPGTGFSLFLFGHMVVLDSSDERAEGEFCGIRIAQVHKGDEKDEVTAGKGRAVRRQERNRESGAVARTDPGQRSLSVIPCA